MKKIMQRFLLVHLGIFGVYNFRFLIYFSLMQKLDLVVGFEFLMELSEH